LPARKHNLFSVPQNENKASVLVELWFFHLAQVNNTASAGAKENWAIYPLLAFLESAPYEKLAVGEMDEGEISARFEKRNILNPPNPDLDIISQKNTITTTKYGGRAFLHFLAICAAAIDQPKPTPFHPNRNMILDPRGDP
jgi:hypothetical protein